MIDKMYSEFKDSSDWIFNDQLDSIRSEKLNCVKNADVLVEQLTDLLESNNRIVIARECAGKDLDDKRVVVQFFVGKNFFDWFFNGKTGYRAHYQQSPISGLIFNTKLIQVVVDYFSLKDNRCFNGYEFEEGFTNIRSVEISKEFLMKSLHPYYSKIWCCDTRIENDGNVSNMTIFRSTSIFQFNDWKEVYADDDDCSWLDIKGGFIDSAKGYLYQPKEPFLERAYDLYSRGAA